MTGTEMRLLPQIHHSIINSRKEYNQAIYKTYVLPIVTCLFKYTSCTYM